MKTKPNNGHAAWFAIVALVFGIVHFTLGCVVTAAFSAYIIGEIHGVKHARKVVRT